MRKNLAKNSVVDSSGSGAVVHRAAARAWFADLLWKVFGGDSEHEVARRAAPVLDVSERQVLNWLRCENDAGLSKVTAVLVLAGFGAVFDRVAA